MADALAEPTRLTRRDRHDCFVVSGPSSRRTSEESTMDTLLCGLAFAAFILAQVAAVVAVHAESNIRQSNAFDAARFDRRTRLILESGS
jgi:hypothetical protein